MAGFHLKYGWKYATRESGPRLIVRFSRYLPRLGRRAWADLYPETSVEPRIPTTEELAADIFDPYMTRARLDYARIFSEIELAVTGNDDKGGLPLQFWLTENPETFEPLDALCLNALNLLINSRGMATVSIQDKDDELSQESIIIRGFDALHSLYIEYGQGGEHPLDPLVKAWQSRPIPTEADRQPTGILAQPVATMRAHVQQGELPTELDTTAPMGRLREALQGELPGLEYANSPVVPVLPLELYSRLGGPTLTPGRGAPLSQRIWFEAVIEQPTGCPRPTRYPTPEHNFKRPD